MIEVELRAVRKVVPQDVAVMVLRELGGSSRELQIFIGPIEARAIAYEVNQIPTDRPFTHDLIVDFFEALDTHVEAVEITELRNTTFIAEVRLRHGVDTRSVSARPSDALAIAVRCGCPIFVHEDVLEDAGVVTHVSDDENEKSEAVIEEFKDFIDAVQPEDFA